MIDRLPIHPVPDRPGGVALRPERAGDEGAVRDLHLSAFGEHGRTVAPLVDDLRRTLARHEGASLVADLDGRVVAHVLFTRSLLDAPRRLVDVQVLSPVAVLPALQGRRIGSALIASGLDLLAGRGVPVVFLEGSPAYYSRLGFSAGAAQGFRRPSLRIPGPAFQARTLPAYETWMTGTLVYPQIFWDHDAVGLRDPEA